jgi:DNA-binding response OmpR family regulator
MVTQIPTAILAFGSPTMISGLISLIGGENMHIVGISDSHKVYSLLNQKLFDMVIVDTQIQDAAPICRNIVRFSGLPVALMFRETELDWSQFSNLEVDGYLSQGSGKAELIARIRAVTRRKQVKRKVESGSHN